MAKFLFVLPETYSEIGNVAQAFGVNKATQNAQCDFDICLWSDRVEASKSTDAEFIAFFIEANRLTQNSLVLVNQAFEANPEVAVVYGDSKQTLLPDISPQRLLRQNYLNNLVFVRASKLREKGGITDEFSSSASVYKFLLSMLEQKQKFAHLDVPLSVELEPGSWKNLSDSEIHESREVLKEAWAERGGASVGDYLGGGVFDVTADIVGNPLISIVIPTQAKMVGQDGDQVCLVLDAVESIMHRTSYDNFELVIVFDSSADQTVLSKLREIAGSKLKLVEWDKPFNFSLKMNFGVLHASGEYVLLLNDDVEVLNEDWLTSMLGLCQLPNAGMVGAMLYYEDDTIQHAGHAYFEGSPTHIGLGVPRGSDGPNHGYKVAREISGVTAACALMPMKVFKAVGGFTSLLPGNFNDVDLCLKVGWKEFDIYWTPQAELYHFESKSRDAHVHYYELDVIEHRWGLRLSDNRYWRGHPWAAQ